MFADFLAAPCMPTNQSDYPSRKSPVKPIFIKTVQTLFITLCLGSSAQASETVAGSFIASKTCDLYSSFAKKTNPDALQTKSDTVYVIKEINKSPDYAWLRVIVPDANPSLRWVSRDCGKPQIVGMDGWQPAAPAAPAAPAMPAMPQPAHATVNAGNGGQCSTANQEDSYVLAITWQPGFCEHFPYQGKKPECDAIHKGDLVVTNLTLHGLWPNKKECGIRYGSCPGVALKLAPDTVSYIAKWMPNFMYETKFGTYEWEKHGVCQSRDADTYFKTAVAAVEEVNNSSVGKFILARVGKSFQAAEFFAEVKKDYGDHVARNIMLSCASGSYLQELRFKLPLNFETGKGLQKLIGDADGFASQIDKCGSEIRVEANGRSH
jgi:ribonuclease T2